LQRCAGSQFDPDLVGVFSVAWDEAELDALVWQAAAS
jgi:hypothetical protein